MSCNNFLQKSDDSCKARIVQMQELLKEKSLDGWIIEDPLDLYYLTGLSLSLGELWISKEEVMLLVDSRYYESVQKEFPFLSALTSDKEIEGFILRNKLLKVGFDSAKTSFEEADKLMKKEGVSVTWKPVPHMTGALRKIKDQKEILLIKKSAALLWEGYLYIKTVLKEGVSEKEVARKFEIFCLEKGADGLSFEPIIAFGENSAFPHYRAGERRLKQGDIVLIDIGAVFQKYCSDMTRVVFFGSPDPLLVEWLDLVIKAGQAAMLQCHAQIPFKELDLAARIVLKEAQVEEYFVHSLGHGIGLEVHEAPRIKFDAEGGLIKTGMVFTIEPGLYLPGRGGVRYEDMIIMTEKGPENLFPFDKAFL